MSVKRRFVVMHTLLFLVLAFPACAQQQPKVMDHEGYTAAREKMMKTDIQARGVKDPAVLTAMQRVPREAYVLPSYKHLAYLDRPLPIASGQTISQPYIVAAMTEAIQPKSDHCVLEVGTGSGYQAAVLGEIVNTVYSIEIVESLALSAAAQLKQQGYTNVTVKAGDGYRGWPEHAPFDSIIVTAAPDHIPQPLVDQLKPGGRMIIPVGPQGDVQKLLLITKDEAGGVKKESLMLVHFVPFTGEAQRRKK